jgi:isopenicillin N synthase-like dioxygenase
MPGRAGLTEGGSMANPTVPTLDISRCSSAELAETLIDWSCALVVGHGVPRQLQRDMSAVSAAFFDLPEQEKELVRWPGTGMWHAWVPVYQGTEDLSHGGVPDLVEWFQIQEFDGFGLWPARPPEMRQVWEAYFRACSELAVRVTTMVADALDLPGEELPAWTERQFCNLAVNNYPPQAEAPLPGQLRLSQHTDENALTLLIANDAPGGLEVRKPGTSAWTPVAIPPDAFFIQPGDLLARRTNRLIHANVHRVVNPPRELAASSRRQTIVFFQYPDRSALVTPAPSCVARTGGEPLPPLQAWDHLMRNQTAYAAGQTERRLDDQAV